MFENMVFRYLMQQKLQQVSDDVDKREGSIIWDAMGPNSAETEQQYIMMDWILEQMSPQTAQRPYLKLLAYDTKGLVPYEASAAVRKGIFNMEIPIGERFTLNECNYTVTAAIDTPDQENNYTYQLTCETAGVIGNKDFGNLFPVTAITGLTRAVLSDVLIPGEDEEDTEAFRQRWKDSFQNIAFGGNAADYMQRIDAIAGVGGCKVFRATSAGGQRVGGYVKCYIIDADYEAASAALVAEVQSAIDPLQDGDGTEGTAPIGHIVTIAAAEGVTINVTAAFTCKTGYSFAIVQAALIAAVEDYLLSLRREWESNKDEGITVRLSYVEMMMLTVEGIEDIQNTRLNGSAQNLVLTAEQVPILGTLTEG